MSGFDLGESYLSFKTSDLEGLAREILSPAILEKAMSAALDEMERQLEINFAKRQGQWRPLLEAPNCNVCARAMGQPHPSL
jgi:hypothetical protein